MVVKGKRSEDGTVVESVTNTCLCGEVLYTHTHDIQVRCIRRAATAGLGQ